MDEHDPGPDQSPPAEQPKRSPRRKKLTRLAILVVALVAVAGGLTWWLHARHFENTDDAQVDADIVNLSPKVAGTLRAVHVVDNQRVEEGQLIAEIDPIDYEVAVAQARAAVAQAKATDDDARRERTRAEKLFKEGAIAAAEHDRRLAAADAADAAMKMARTQLQAAELHVSYCKIVAPARGIIGKKSIDVGDHVAPGQQLLAIARVDHVWVTANFRENQLQRMQPGQPVKVHVDALGRDFQGKVESFGGATGARFSVLPPENASGNYVKVVQRIPVRIALDPGQPGLERLRPGMSVEPKVKIG